MTLLKRIKAWIDPPMMKRVACGRVIDGSVMKDAIIPAAVIDTVFDSLRYELRHWALKQHSKRVGWRYYLVASTLELRSVGPHFPLIVWKVELTGRAVRYPRGTMKRRDLRLDLFVTGLQAVDEEMDKLKAQVLKGPYIPKEAS